MFSWTKNFFGTSPSSLPKKDARQAPPPPNPATVEEVHKHLAELIGAGLRLGPMYDEMTLAEVAWEISNDDNLRQGLDQTELRPIHLLWQQRDEGKFTEEPYRGFRNAILLVDHCYDGAVPEDFQLIISDIIALTESAWPVSNVDVTCAQEESFNEPLDVSIETDSRRISFRIQHLKDLDFSLFEKLNANLPEKITQRFHAIGDGGAVLVLFLEKAQVEKIARYCDLDPSLFGIEQ